ncbi:MAG: hypothetical protein ACRELF_27810, partial [Gemmataceae bacterium]
LRDTPKGGWTLTLKDADGNLLRRFVDSGGNDNRPDIWSYYKDGVEVYSEIDSTFSGKPDQYRWFNSCGSRWGVDRDKDGRIDHWKAISAEEVSQEILQALINKDFARLQALLLTEDELKALNLPAEQASRIREQIKTAPDKFRETLGKLNKLGPKTTWIHLETAAPQRLLAENSSSHADILKLPRGTLLYDNGGASDWIQTGEMYLLPARSASEGQAWRIVAAPVPGAAAPDASFGKGGGQLELEDDPQLQKLIAELTELDKRVPANVVGNNPALARHHLQRADILQSIVAKAKPSQRDPWIRQVADSLSTAAQSDANDQTAMTRLLALEQQLVKALPAGHLLTAYVTFREMQADYW